MEERERGKLHVAAGDTMYMYVHLWMEIHHNMQQQATHFKSTRIRFKLHFCSTYNYIQSKSRKYTNTALSLCIRNLRTMYMYVCENVQLPNTYIRVYYMIHTCTYMYVHMISSRGHHLLPWRGRRRGDSLWYCPEPSREVDLSSSLQLHRRNCPSVPVGSVFVCFPERRCSVPLATTCNGDNHQPSQANYFTYFYTTGSFRMQCSQEDCPDVGGVHTCMHVYQ